MSNSTTPPPSTTRTPIFQSRKFIALFLMLALYLFVVLLTFLLVWPARQATFEDFKEILKSMNLLVMPVASAYVIGTAIEGFAEKRAPSAAAVGTVITTPVLPRDPTTDELTAQLTEGVRRAVAAGPPRMPPRP